MASVYSIHGPAPTQAKKAEEFKFGKKERKTPTDPNAPKKPLTAFFSWAADNREKLQKKNKEASVPELSKIIATEWKGLNKKNKDKYEDAAKNDSNKYKILMNAYKHTASFQSHQARVAAFKIHLTKKAFKLDPNMPKRPLSGYMMFCVETRPVVTEKQPDLKMTEVAVKLSEEWNALKEAEKIKWRKKSDDAKLGHIKVMIEYKKTEDFKKYEAEKEEYLKEMKAKRQALMKKGNMDKVKAGSKRNLESRERSSGKKKAKKGKVDGKVKAASGGKKVKKKISAAKKKNPPAPKKKKSSARKAMGGGKRIKK